MRKYLRSDIVEPKFNVADRTSKLDPYADKLSRMLLQEAGRASASSLEVIKNLACDDGGATLASSSRWSRNPIHLRRGSRTPLPAKVRNRLEVDGEGGEGSYYIVSVGISLNQSRIRPRMKLRALELLCVIGIFVGPAAGVEFIDGDQPGVRLRKGCDA